MKYLDMWDSLSKFTRYTNFEREITFSSIHLNKNFFVHYEIFRYVRFCFKMHTFDDFEREISFSSIRQNKN